MRSLRAIVCALLLFSTYLIVAGPARAFEWTIEEESLASLEISKETTTVTGGVFRLLVPGLLAVECTSESGSGEILEKAESSASLTFTGCKVEGNKFCVVSSPGKSTGTLAAAATMKFLEKEVSKTEKYYDQIALTMGVNFSGAGCALVKENTVEGTIAAEVPQLGEKTAKRVQKFSQTIAEASGVSNLKFDNFAAYLDGEDKEVLSGVHKEQQMAPVPVTINPAPVAFAGIGAGNAKAVTIGNVGVRNLELKELGVTGPYGMVDPNNCTMNPLTVPPNMGNTCTVTVTCNEAKPGKFLVVWKVAVAGAPEILTKVKMTC
jgi:hypothetical protein